MYLLAQTFEIAPELKRLPLKRKQAMLLRAMNVNLPAYLAPSMRELGRYAVVALIVPGGCLIALAIWAFRHRAWLARRVRHWRLLRSRARPLIHSAPLLNRITAVCEAAHSCFDARVRPTPPDAMVFLQAEAPLERRRPKRR
jgi:hypothetical protein